VRVVCRFSRPAEVDPRSVMVGPKVDQMTGELGAVVGKQILGRPALRDQAIENLDDMLAAQMLANFDCETFAAEHVNDREGSELLPVAELVRDEVQAPGLVHTLRPAPGLAMDQHLAPLRLFAAENQTFLPIQPVDQVPPDVPAVPLQHDMDATIPVAERQDSPQLAIAWPRS